MVFGCSELLTLRRAQLPVVKIALLVPNDVGLASLFHGIALLVQDAFNPCATDIARAMAVLSLLGVTCKQHAVAVERRVAASTAASLGLRLGHGQGHGLSAANDASSSPPSSPSLSTSSSSVPAAMASMPHADDYLFDLTLAQTKVNE